MPMMLVALTLLAACSAASVRVDPAAWRAESAGKRVLVVTYQPEKASVVSAGVAVAGDLTEEAPANRLIATCVERFGRIDILVNDVGGSRNAKIWEMKVEDWDFVQGAARGGPP